MKYENRPRVLLKVPGGSNDALSTGKILQGNYFAIAAVSSGCLQNPVQEFDITNLIGKWTCRKWALRAETRAAKGMANSGVPRTARPIY